MSSASDFRRSQSRYPQAERQRVTQVISNQIENAVRQVLDMGFRTADIYENGKTKVGCEEMGDLIIKELEKNKKQRKTK